VGWYEDNVSEDAPQINYVTYEKQSTRCTVHGLCPLGQHECFTFNNVLPGTSELGSINTIDSKKKVAKVVTNKFPTLRSAKIDIFIRHISLPVLEKCRYHFADK
jgi:hypothetical protein